jgi:phosphatidylserine decarboxylase
VNSLRDQHEGTLFITKYGYDVVGTVVLLVALGSLVIWFAVDARVLKYGLFGLLTLLLLFTLNFFRDPDRHTPSGDNLIIAPADGTVVLIKEVDEDEYLKGSAVQVSIFMSPLNVHVNRYPISGTVGYFRYCPGEYLVAYDDKSSLRNERTHIGVENARTKVLFKQIAGLIARRIVAPVKEGYRAVAGERFGMIKFGSRVDVIMPRNLALKIKLGDRTIAGETVLAAIS